MRIVSLVPSATETLFALGLGSDVIAVTHECDYPAAALELPKITRDVLPTGLSAGEIDAAVKERTLAGLSIYGAMLLMPLYLQQARGYSALAAGLILVPQGVGSVLPRTIVGKLTDWMGPRPVTLAGIVLAGIGTIPFALAGSHPSTWFLCAGLVIRGAGLGAATIALMAGAFQGLPKADVPHASSTTRIMQQVGGAFGAAVLVVILATQAGGHGASPATLAAAFGHTFWWCIGFTALAVLPALLMPGRPGQPPAPAADAQAADSRPAHIQSADSQPAHIQPAASGSPGGR